MAKEKKIAHDYFLDCCKKYGIKIVSDRRVRSHYETIIEIDGRQYKQNYLTIYREVGDKSTGMLCFKNIMSDHFLKIGDIEQGKYWNSSEMLAKDILYTPKQRRSPLMETYNLLNKALELAKANEDFPQDVLAEIVLAHNLASTHLAERGE